MGNAFDGMPPLSGPDKSPNPKNLYDEQKAGKGNAETYHDLAKELHNDTNVHTKLYQQNVFASNGTLNRADQMPDAPKLEISRYNHLPQRKVYGNTSSNVNNIFGSEDTHIQPAIAERHTYSPSTKNNIISGDGYGHSSPRTEQDLPNHPQYLVKKNKQTM